MLRKITAIFLVLIMSFGTVTAFASQKDSFSTETIVENGIEKSVTYFGEIKIVSWDDDDEVYVEQYDSDGTLVETNIGNRTTKKVKVISDTEVYTMNADDVIKIVSTEELPVPYSFSKIDTIKAYSAVDKLTKNMYLYQEIGSAQRTGYRIEKYNGKVANFVANLATGISVSAAIANAMLDNLVASGIGVITGTIIEIFSSIYVSCDAYAYNYYGKDSTSGEKSSTLKKAGYKYIVNDDLKDAFNGEVYYDGFVYKKINSITDYNLCIQLVTNLYGANYDVL